jgi:hypothetical protein
LNNNNLGDIFIMQKNINIAILALIMFFRVTVNLSGMKKEFSDNNSQANTQPPHSKRKKTSFSNINLDENSLIFEDLELEIAEIQKCIDEYKSRFDFIIRQNQIINMYSLAEKIDNLNNIFIKSKLRLEKIGININKDEEIKLIEILRSSASKIIDLFERICSIYENHLGDKKFKVLGIKLQLDMIIVSYKNLVKEFFFSNDRNDLIFNIFESFLSN